jgi:hypothetical protein
MCTRLGFLAVGLQSLSNCQTASSTNAKATAGERSRRWVDCLSRLATEPLTRLLSLSSFALVVYPFSAPDSFFLVFLCLLRSATLSTPPRPPSIHPTCTRRTRNNNPTPPPSVARDLGTTTKQPNPNVPDSFPLPLLTLRQPRPRSRRPARPQTAAPTPLARTYRTRGPAAAAPPGGAAGGRRRGGGPVVLRCVVLFVGDVVGAC